MTTEDYNFEEMGNLAMNVVDDAPQEDSKIDEVSSIYKLDDELLKEGDSYDFSGAYFQYKYKHESNPDARNIFIKIERNFNTKKKVEIIYTWVSKEDDDSFKKLALFRRDTLPIEEDIEDSGKSSINKKIAHYGRNIANVDSTEGIFKETFQSIVRKIANSSGLEVFKELDYEIPEYPEDDEPFEDTSDVINSFSEYPEDIQQEAMKILNDGLLFEEIQNSVSLTHQGDYTSRDALILMEASLFVDGKGNTLNSVHGLIGGDSGGGKSDLAIVVGLNFPQKYVKNLRNSSPKYPYYDNENFNEDYNIIVFDDPRLTEEVIELIKLFADNTTIEKVLKTVKNQEPLILSFGDAKFVVILTYAKTLPDDELANRLFNLGVIVDEEKPDVSDKVRDNNQTNGNFNPIIERYRLIIQASIHYLIEQEINVFNPFLSIFNTQDYISRDVNHVHHMIKTKTFYEYPQRRQIQFNEDLAITIGAFEDFKFVSDIWSEDVDAQRYKLSERQKQILKLLPEMTSEEAYKHIEDLNDNLTTTQSRKAKAKLLDDEYTKKNIAKKLKCNQNTLVNDLDRNNRGTSKSLYELGLIDKIQIQEGVSNSPNIYYKIKSEVESSNPDETTMYDMYSQFTQSISYSFTKQKIIIDLLYYVKIVINEGGHTYLKNYCDNYDKDIDVESYDSIVDFIEGFFDGFKYDEYRIPIDNAPLDVITQMAKYKHEIDNLFNEKNNGDIVSQNSEVLHSNEKTKENPPIVNSSKDTICKKELHNIHNTQSDIQSILEEINVEYGIAHEIYGVLSSGNKNLEEIRSNICECVNPDDFNVENLPLKVEVSLKRLVEHDFLVTIEPINQAKRYELTSEFSKLFEGDDD